jgi:hypothetical protein
MIYCAEMAEVSIIKIGWTNNLEKRFKRLWYNSPLTTVPKYALGAKFPKVAMLRTFEGERRLESAILYHFRKHRIWGEWFCAHAVKEPLLALTEAELPQIRREYWESYPSNARPSEFQGTPQTVPFLSPPRRFNTQPCYQHRV